MIDELFSSFSDATVYFIMGAGGSLIFAIRLALMMFGLGGDVNMDADLDVDGGIGIHGSGFSLLSLTSIVAFVMGAGWLGLACRVEWNQGPVRSALFASAFGFGLMLMCSYLMFQMKKFDKTPKYDLENCVGHIGRVYMRIPVKGEGQGKVEITVDGRRKIIMAESSGDSIESFTVVKVIDVREARTLIVEKDV